MLSQPEGKLPSKEEITSMPAVTAHEALKAENTHLKQLNSLQRLRYDQAVTDLRNKLAERGSAIGEQNKMIEQFRRFHGGGGGSRGIAPEDHEDNLLIGLLLLSSDSEYDEKLIRRYVSEKKKGSGFGEDISFLRRAEDAIKLETLRPQRLGRTPAEEKIYLADVLLLQPDVFSELLRDLLWTRPELFPFGVEDILGELEEKAPDWFQKDENTGSRGFDHFKSGEDMNSFTDKFRENPEVLLLVAEALLEMNPRVIEYVNAEIVERGGDLLMIATMIVIPILSYFIAIPLLQDPNEKRRKELEKKRRKIEKQKQRESSARPRSVVVLSQNKSPKAKKKHRTEGKRRKTQLVLTVDEEKKQKQLWMKGIHRVHLEATVKFRKIRRELDAMNLERVEPKQKNKKETPAPQSMPSFLTLSTAGGDKKAGKSQYIILVGDPNNLYKTRNIKRSMSEIPSIDLHGMSKNEAVSKLDENLPHWIDIAMRGSYPFVIPVKIVCGKGSQTLSEAVAEWIRKKKEVSNAPKDLVK